MRSLHRVPAAFGLAALTAAALLEWASPARARAPSRLLGLEPVDAGTAIASRPEDAWLDGDALAASAAEVLAAAGAREQPPASPRTLEPSAPVDPWAAGLRARLAEEPASADARSSAQPPAASAPAPRPLRVAVISDLNGSYGSTDYNDDVHAAIARIVALQPDLVLNTGDMVAGQRRGLDYPAMWSAFHDAVTDPLRAARIPMAMTPGNHDASGHALFGAERAEYGRQWMQRRPELQYVDDAHFPFRYTFAAGPAFFVSLDATGVGPLDGEQMTWLATQLEAADAWPVRVVFGHVPLYPFSKEKHDEILGDPALEELLNAHGVTLFLSGHHHTYYPGRRGDLRLVGTSCLGTGLRHLLGTDERSPRSFVLLEIDASGVREVEAFSGVAFDERVERASLPESLGSPSQRIWRDDVTQPR